MKLRLFGSVLLLALSSFFIATTPINTRTANALPASSCAFDLFYVLDLSSSMGNTISGGGGNKLQVLKSVVTTLNSELAALNPGTQIGYASFKGSDTGLPLPDTWAGGGERRWLQGDIADINSRINSLWAFDGTPMEYGIGLAKPGFHYRGYSGYTAGEINDNIPVGILISDGIPTISYTVADSHDSRSGNRTYDEASVSAVDIKDSNGNFLSPDQVRLLGSPSNDPWLNPHLAGEVLANTMEMSLSLNNLAKGPPVTMGLFIQGQGAQDNPDIIEHFGNINGDNFFTVATANEMRNALVSLLDETCNSSQPQTGELVINLPPKSVYTPDQMLVEGHTYTFSNDEFNPPHTDGFITVSTETITQGGIDSYEITVGGLRRGEAIGFEPPPKLTAFNRFIKQFSAQAYTPPPATNVLLLGPALYDIKMTFDDQLATQSTLGSLSRQLNNYEYAKLTDSNCAEVQQGATHMCFFTKVSAANFTGGISGELLLKDIVEMDFPGTITVEGNVIATGSIGGFTLPSSSNWLAVGGTINTDLNAQESQKLRNYLDAGSSLVWGNGIGQKIIDKKNSGIDIATVFPPDAGQSTTTFTDGNFNLNAPGTNPKAAGESTFSSGPEGKIWYNGNLNSTVTLNNINVKGVGTIIVRGNLVVNDRLACSSGTRFGVIATGSVVFNTPNIECGTYVALGEVNSGDITFNTNVSQNTIAKGIFIAKGDITLPSVDPGSDYTINYDNDFAIEPSALFKEILEIVFTTSS